jgi:hypothetical protein
MLDNLRKFQEATDDFFDTRIFFNKELSLYKFQGIWISSGFEKYIETKISSIKDLLFIQLKHDLNNKSFLLKLQKELRETHQFLYDIYYDEFDDLAKSYLKIHTTHSKPDESITDLYTYDFFVNIATDKKALKKFKQQKIKFPELFKTLLDLFIGKNEVDYPSSIQFENAKLLTCIYCYRTVLFDFLSEIDYYVENFDFINFSLIDTIDNQKNAETVKCKMNLSKIELARFFKFLMIEKYLYFDVNDSSKNKIMLERFIENNFTYKMQDGKQGEIKNLKREFAESHLEIKNNYNELLDELIGILESKRKS